MFDLGNIKAKLDATSSFKKLSLLQGYEGVWISARRNNYWYAFNKLFSIAIALTFATLTLMTKKHTLIYQELVNENEPDNTSAFHVRSIYWFMFIYYSFHAMDEMIEGFSVLNQLEKGALGLFFELNYLIGLFLSGYCIWFVSNFVLIPAKALAGETLTDAELETRQGDFNSLRNWLVFQKYFFMVCIFISAAVWVLYSRMNTSATNETSKVNKAAEEANTAINEGGNFEDDVYKRQQ